TLHAGAYLLRVAMVSIILPVLDMNAPPTFLWATYGAQPYGAQPLRHATANPMPRGQTNGLRLRTALPLCQVLGLSRERDAQRMATTTREDKGKSTVVQQKKSYPNKEVSEGVWRFRVEVDRDQVRQTFVAQTDMTWPEFEAEAFEQFNLAVSGQRWESDLGVSHLPIGLERGVANVREKILVARTRAVSMEIKDVSTLNRPKAHKKGKGKEKRSRDDDITPGGYAGSQVPRRPFAQFAETSAMRRALEGLRVALTNIQSIGKAFKHLRPNVKPCDRPPAKRPRGAKVAPDVHIAVNITPTHGVGVGALQSTYVVSGAQVQSGPESGPSHATQASDITVHTEAPAPAPTENGSPSPPAYGSQELLSDCRTQGRVPLVYEILTLIDAEEPVPNLTYLDSHTDLYNFGYKDAIQLFALDESLLSGFGLGRENARRVHRFIQDKFFRPLGGLMDTASHEPPSTEVQDSVRHDDGVKGQTIKEETGVVWLTIPDEIVDISDDEEDGIDGDEIDEDELEDDNSVESDIASVTSV
ncbi:hypothetical protein EDB84DRAFT_1447145, partial [Lactarius hengduanensis]